MSSAGLLNVFLTVRNESPRFYCEFGVTHKESPVFSRNGQSSLPRVHRNEVPGKEMSPGLTKSDLLYIRNPFSELHGTGF